MSCVYILEINPLQQWSPTVLTRGTGFVEDNFSMDGDRGRWFWFLPLFTSCCVHNRPQTVLVYGLGVGTPALQDSGFYFILNSYLFGCVGSQLWHMGSSLWHAASFVATYRL